MSLNINPIIPTVPECNDHTVKANGIETDLNTAIVSDVQFNLRQNTANDPNTSLPGENLTHVEFNSKHDPYAQMAKNICENKELTKLRDWLLPMLMNGQASIED